MLLLFIIVFFFKFKNVKMKEKSGNLSTIFNFAFFILGKRQLNFFFENNRKGSNLIGDVKRDACLFIFFEMAYFYKDDFIFLGH